MTTFAGLNPPYSTIVADPPWHYDSGGPVGSGGRGYNDHSLNVAARDRYSTLTADVIAALPVEAIACDAAHLYLWTTNAFMAEAHAITSAWGFTPKTILTWVKVHRDDPTRVSMKTGYYFRGATEHVVFGVRGSLPLSTDEGIPTAFLLPRLPHSVKPAAFFDVVERVSPGPYVELFARQPRLGWDSWGHGYELGEAVS